jgi:hypothetical protein
MLKPSVFIGSSSEGYAVATTVADALSSFATCSIWKEAFDFGKSSFDNLSSKIALYDYAILIATKDDLLQSRKTLFDAPRDNVVFEFGLFVGGLGKEKVYYLCEEGAKIFSDLSGITISTFEKSNNDSILKQAELIMKDMQSKESTYHLGFLPSTALAYGYFVNFVERTVERLLEDRRAGKTFRIEDGSSFTIKTIRFTILLPDDLGDNMFQKVKAKRLRDGWQKLKVDPKDVRDYDFSVDVSEAANGLMHLVDIPLTLNALNKAIELYSERAHLGKNDKERIFEQREIRNFQRTLEYLTSQSSITRGIVSVNVVDI